MALTPEHEEDFRRFVEVHWLGLVRSAYLLVGDRGAAEDLVGQTLATVYGHWDRRMREGAPFAYVRRALIDEVISNDRRGRVRAALLGAAARAGLASAPEGLRPDRGDAYCGVDDGDLVVRALRDLPAQMRAVVVLRYFDDLTEAATADLLGISVGSVTSESSRGLQRLHDALADRPSEMTSR